VNWFQWLLCGVGAFVPGYLFLRWLRWNTFVPVPGRAQDVSAVCRRQSAVDVEQAVEEAIYGQSTLFVLPTEAEARAFSQGRFLPRTNH